MLCEKISYIFVVDGTHLMHKFLYILLLFPAILRAQSISITVPTDTVCTGSPVTFTAIATGISSPHYQWKVNSLDAGTDSTGFTTNTLTDGDTIKCLLTNSPGTVVYATSASIVMTIENMPNAGVITGPDIVCHYASILLTDTVAGGEWSTENDNASVSGGVVTGLNVIIGIDNLFWSSYDSIYYTVTNSCGSDRTAKLIEIHPLPNANFFLGIPGSFKYSLCVGEEVFINGGVEYPHLLFSSYGYTEPVMSNKYLRGVNAGRDILIGVHSNYCGIDTFRMAVNVYEPPEIFPIIVPTTEICVGESISLADSSKGMLTWHSTKNGHIVSWSGVLTGISPGLDTITLQSSNQCGARYTDTVININPPGQILSPDTLCKDQSTTLTNSYPGGIWSSSNPAIATVSQSGQLDCLAADTVYISYTLGSCTVTKKEIINPLPVITGKMGICPNEETTLTASLTGKKWSTGNSDAATIDSFGNIKGINHGSSLISFTANNGCSTSTELTINPLPATITGDPGICLKRGNYLYNEVPGGKWSSDRPYTASIDSLSGFISGISDGVANITYTLPTGCNITRQVITSYCYEEQNIFPNPASHEINIEADTAIYFEYAIINYMGQMTTRAPITATFTTLDITTLPRGFYFIYLWGKVYLHGDHRMHIERFIKQ